MKRRFLLASGLLWLTLSPGLRAEVVTDGSLGPAGSLAGPDFQITADLGRQVGPNLFHSFGSFNVGREESATFSGPSEVRNVIGRVTGGQSSHIDGALRSTIPNADLYLLNPSGVLIGEHATLDVGGSLYVSSADHLEMSDGSRFSASQSESSVLSVAPPASFGFLSSAPAAVRVRGAQLEVAAGRDITLAGGEVAVEQGAKLRTSGGRLTLSAVSGPAQVGLNGEISGADGGRVQLGADSTLDASGPGGGRIFIRGGQVWAQGADILSQTEGASQGAGVHIQGSDSIRLDDTRVQSAALASGAAGPLELEAPEIRLDNGSALLSSSYSSGPGGETRISAHSLTLSGESGIYSESGGSGAAGPIRIQLDDLLLSGNSLISGNSYGGSAGGDIHIDATGRIEIHGDLISGGKPFMLQASALDSGRAGDIRIQAAQLHIEDAVVDVSSAGSGAAGTVDLDVSGSIQLRNGAIQAASKSSGPGGILRVRADSFAATDNGGLLALGVGSGPGGSIDVEAERIELTDGAEFSNEIFYAAPSTGSIRVNAGESLVIRGRSEPDPYPSGSVPGAGRVSTGIFSYTGDVTVAAPNILVADSGQIAARTQNDSAAGRLSVSGERITLLNGGQISGDAIGSSLWYGSAGHVAVSATEFIRMSGEVGERNSGIYAASRSSGDAGVIEVAAPLILVENGGHINTSTGVFTDNSAGGITLRGDQVLIRNNGALISVSQGHAGGGGDIEIHALDAVEITGDSYVSAWGSREGHSGRILIDAPDILLRDGNILTTNVGTQNAGDILIQTDRIRILEGSTLRSNTTEGGDAGSVTILASQLIEADGSGISTEALRASGGNILLQAATVRLRATPVTATVAGGSGDGGNVTLAADAIAATHDSDITARADQGRGGRILIDAEVFLRDASIDLDASSNVAGNEGVVEVNAPQLDLSATIKELPADYLDAAALLADRCSARSSADRGSLVVRGMESAPPTHEGYLLSFPEEADGERPSDADVETDL